MYYYLLYIINYIYLFNVFVNYCFRDFDVLKTCAIKVDSLFGATL